MNYLFPKDWAKTWVESKEVIYCCLGQCKLKKNYIFSLVLVLTPKMSNNILENKIHKWCVIYSEFTLNDNHNSNKLCTTPFKI